MRQSGDQQRQPDSERKRGGFHCASQRDHLSGDQRQLQRLGQWDRSELPMVQGRQRAGGRDQQQPGFQQRERGKRRDLPRGGRRGVRQSGDQQRQPDGERKRGGFHCASRRDQLSGDQRQLQRLGQRDRFELSMVQGRRRAGGRDQQQPGSQRPERGERRDLQRGGRRGVRHSGDQQRQPDGERKCGGFQCASQRDQLSGDQRRLQRLGQRDRSELSMVEGRQRPGGRDQQQ